MSKIKELYDQIDVANEEGDWEEYFKLMDDLRSIDPFNEIFHLGCLNWPHCESEGCGEGR